jgi:hypothetical protein
MAAHTHIEAEHLVEPNIRFVYPIGHLTTSSKSDRTLSLPFVTLSWTIDPPPRFPKYTALEDCSQSKLHTHPSPRVDDETHTATSVQSHRTSCCGRSGRRKGVRRIEYIRLFNSPLTLWRKLRGRLSCGSRADSLHDGRKTGRLEARGGKGTQSRGAEDQPSAEQAAERGCLIKEYAKVEVSMRCELYDDLYCPWRLSGHIPHVDVVQ